jgi:hypothetical protein
MLFQVFFMSIHTVYLYCIQLINITFLLFSFLYSPFKVEKPTKRQIRSHTYTQKHTLRAWKGRRKKKEKKVKILLALLVQKRVVHRGVGRERERKKSSQRLHTCKHRPKKHTFTILLFFLSISNFFYSHWYLHNQCDTIFIFLLNLFVVMTYELNFNKFCTFIIISLTIHLVYSSGQLYLYNR